MGATPRLGMPLPNFTARTTHGVKSLSDFQGSWLVLFSHPSDFTPVCTSEFMAIARAAERFAALDCALMALSIDSLYSHFAWIRLIHERFDVKVDFPIIEDPTLEIARAYGMVPPDARDASTVRYTYFIDPRGLLRASTCYPTEIGRSVEEMLRMVAALQRADATGHLAPAGWEPGKELLRAPTQDIGNVFAAQSPVDWFYAPVEDKTS
ncbi:peroxiredoxin [Sphingosinithalassobacter tenebrarum]|uniref:Thioredoxin peroxidase n=1 Tax=Stakelama tenebrarum TaxID=2711215 RepID=A0A6G6YB48_9SPHN|nr:peroxiredoxin [Sphingosinithalassobacter tenebrarum]